jgi:hypothetical protein
MLGQKSKNLLITDFITPIGFWYIATTRVKGKGKAIPIQALTGPQVSRRLRFSGFLDTWHKKMAVLSTLCTGCLHPQETSLVPTSIRQWVQPSGTVRLEGLSQWKISMTPLEIKTATYKSEYPKDLMFVYIIPHSLISYSIKILYVHFGILSWSRHRPPCFNYNVLW